MNAETFYQRAMTLKGKGAMAMFSMGEIKLLMNEVKAAAKVARGKRLADIAANRTPRYCPPDKSGMSSDEFLNRLGQMSAEERRHIDMTEASTRIMAARYPCRA